jgi:nitrogen fixation protein NifU and related proteins
MRGMFATQTCLARQNGRTRSTCTTIGTVDSRVERRASLGIGLNLSSPCNGGECYHVGVMNDDLQKRVEEATRNPENMGEMAGADSIGTVGSAECGDMLRVWVKFKEENGRKVIDRASFQSFGCETAIAAASLAMELIRGKTPDEALKIRGEEFARDLGPLPPTKVHCTQLVEGALRSALAPEAEPPKAVSAAPSPAPAGNLDESLRQPRQGGIRVVFLTPQDQQKQRQ